MEQYCLVNRKALARKLWSKHAACSFTGKQPACLLHGGRSHTIAGAAEEDRVRLAAT